MKHFYVFLVVFFTYVYAYAQTCPSAAFTMPATSCTNQMLSFENNSTGAVMYSWDFCSGVDLEIVPEIEDVLPSEDFGKAYDIDLVEHQGNYYGFVATFTGDNIIRLDFGESLETTPNYTDLGNGGVIDDPLSISVVEYNSSWYGFSVSFSKNELYHLDFGNSLENTPSISNITGDLILNSPVAVQAYSSEDGNYVFVANQSGSTVSRVKFDTGFSGDFTSLPISLSLSNDLSDIDFIRSCNEWLGFVVSRNGASVNKLDFGTSLSNSPTEELITDESPVTMSRPTGITMVKETEGYVGFLNSRDNSLYRLSFTSGISDKPEIEDLGNVNGKDRDWGITSAKVQGEWYLLGANFNIGEIFRYKFSNECHASVFDSSEEEPMGVYFDTSGDYQITLNTFDDDGDRSSLTNIITITSDIAPSISISPQDNECLGQPNNFIPIDEGGLTYEWSFDGGETIGSTNSNPVHTFSATGDSVVLLLIDDGTCTNFVRDTVSIYPIPSPAFISSEPYCTNTEITFSNTTNESNYTGATLTYTWSYGDGSSEEAIDGLTIYASANNYDVTLNMAIPGCDTDITETITVIPGPEVSFITDNNCFGETIQFSNQTTGDNLINPSWNFGDEAGSSTLSDPQYIYGETGDFEVILTMENTEGCVNSLTETVRVNGVPEVAFSNTPGCENQAVSFTDISNPGDALNNINTWNWNFNELGSATDENPDFIFDTSGNYLVSLTVGNTGDCYNTIEQTVIVQPVPTPEFEIQLGCIDATTQFIDNSETIAENEIASWYWVINETEYFTQDVVELFSEPGDYSANLVVTPTNLCVATIQKDFTVFDLPTPGFMVDGNCDNEFTILSDTSITQGPSIVSRSWEFDNGDVINGQEIAYQYDEAGNYTVGLRVTDSLGCFSTIDKEIEVFGAPASIFSALVSVGNAPLTVDFVNDSEDATNYLWSFGEGAGSQATDENPQFTYQNLGEYDAQLIAYNDNCSDSSFLEIIVAEPWFDLQLTSVDNTVINGIHSMSLTIENLGLLNLEGFDIKIDFENQTSIYESYDDVLNRNETITYPINFSLPVEGNNVDFLCFTLIDREESVADSVSSNNSGCISFEEQAVVQGIFPNPLGVNDHTLTVQTILSSKSAVQIYLINATGDVMFDQLFQGVNLGLTNFILNVSGLRAGMYFVKVLHNGKEQTQKFIKP